MIKDIVKQNSVAPNDSVLLTSLGTLELLNLAEHMNNTMKKGQHPIVVTLK